MDNPIEFEQIRLKEKDKNDKIKKFYELNIDECPICLEPLDFNPKTNTSNQVYFDDNEIKTISLPCACSNSIYHKNCLVRMVLSAPNKNFCPHCRKKYEIKIDYMTQAESREAEQVRQQIINEERKQIGKYYFIILCSHLLINSVLNIICIKYFIVDLKDNSSTKTLTWFYFGKLLFNFYIASNSKESNGRINFLIIFNSIVQYLLICFVVLLQEEIPYKIFLILLCVQILISFVDFAIRLYYRLKIKVITNRIAIV